MIVQLSWLTLFLGLTLTNTASCLTRRQCNTTTLAPEATYVKCNITQYYLKDSKDILATIESYRDYSTNFIIGSTYILSKGRLEGKDLLGNTEAISHDKFESYRVSISLELTAAALPIAIKNYCQQNPLDLKFIIIYLDDICGGDDNGQTYANSVELMEAGVDVLFKSPCGATNAGLFLNHRNIPLLSFKFSNVLHTLLMGPNSKLLGSTFVEICREFKWNTVSMLYSPSGGYCNSGSNVIKSTFNAEKDLSIIYSASVSSTTKDEAIMGLLKNVKDRSRIVILCLSTPDLRRVMKLALAEGMVTSEYVFIDVGINLSGYATSPWGPIDNLDQRAIDELKAPFQNFKMLTYAGIDDVDRMTLINEIRAAISGYPWYIDYSEDLRESGSIQSLYVYDTLWIYLTIVEELIKQGRNYRNASVILETIRNREFKAASGNVVFDDEGDRLTDHQLLQLKPLDNKLTSFATFHATLPEGKRMTVEKTPYWGTVNKEPPPNEPRCGYQGEKCFTTLQYALLAVLTVAFACFLIVYLFVKAARKNKSRIKQNEKLWKIDCDEIELIDKSSLGGSLLIGSKKDATSRGTRSGLSIATGRSHSIYSTPTTYARNQGKRSRSVSSEASSAGSRRISMLSFADSGTISNMVYYRGVVCSMKKLVKTNFNTTDLGILKQLKEMTHENLTEFVGSCISDPNIYILHEYCIKGSLMDILDRSEMELDWTFRSSLMLDLVNGLEYIHNSMIQFHGFLTSNRCFIDNKWVLKIGYFGMNSLMYTNVVKKEVGEDKIYWDQLWTAPEILRSDSSRHFSLLGTKEGDIYSFGIMLQEIIYRAFPYFMDNIKYKEIIQKVRKGKYPPFRPTQPAGIGVSGTDPKVIQIMVDCWQEVPGGRPDVQKLKSWLQSLFEGRDTSIVDRMLSKLERYANSLEGSVAKRTIELSEQKQRTDMLLCSTMPQMIADTIRRGSTIEPDTFAAVTIQFSEIIDFSLIALTSSPYEIVDLFTKLNDVFNDVVTNYDVNQISTLNGTHMFVSGCPITNGDKHASEIAKMSLQIIQQMEHFKIPHIPTKVLSIRIGIHTGPCVAGLVGSTMPKYSLFGDTVTMASKLQSTSKAMKILVSDQCRLLLNRSSDFVFERMGEIELKDVGKCTTHWLDR